MQQTTLFRMKKGPDPLIVNLPNIMALATDYRTEQDEKTMTNDFIGLKLESKVDITGKPLAYKTTSVSDWKPYAKSPWSMHMPKESK